MMPAALCVTLQQGEGWERDPGAFGHPLPLRTPDMKTMQEAPGGQVGVLPASVMGSTAHLPHTQPTSEIVLLGAWQGRAGLKPWCGVQCAMTALMDFHRGTGIHTLIVHRPEV